jgi:hypothetical protein
MRSRPSRGWSNSKSSLEVFKGNSVKLASNLSKQSPSQTDWIGVCSMIRIASEISHSLRASSLEPAFFSGVQPYPPAMAPTTRRGSAPDSTASGRGASGGSWLRSSSQAKNRKSGRRSWVT